ncbi:MAG: glutathione S-transferase family protein [Myxococcales bacterium]|nr:glutathione S-transferase family protein [Myxococcales bacterium]
MIKVYGFGASFGLPDPSPFVVKVANYLRMIDVPFELLPGNARKAPKGKLPYIDDGGTLLADSSFVIDYLRKRYKDLDVGISARERALATACKSMLEEHLYFVMVTQRWKEDRGYEILKQRFAGTLRKAGIPGFLIPTVSSLIRKQVIKTVNAQGMGRHTPEEIEEIAVNLLDSLSELLGDQKYFLGDAPRSIDATVFAWLWLIIDAPYEGRVKQHACSKPNLVRYNAHMKQTYWKDWK